MPSDKVKTFVADTIKSKKVVMFSKSYCPYCTMAKKAIKEHCLDKQSTDFTKDDYIVIEIENNPDCAEIQAELKRITGASSVPRVFVKGTFIGGGDDTAAMARSGELMKLLK